MSQHKARRAWMRLPQMKWLRVLSVMGLVLAITALFKFNLDSAVVQAQVTLKGDPEQGRVKAALCSACHGVAGVSINPLWPSLAGQQELYLVKQIKAFRDGEREEITMQPFVQNLSDQDAADLAAFYAGLSPCP